MQYIILVAGVLLLTGIIITVAVLYRERMRRQMLQVLFGLTRNYIDEIGLLSATGNVMEKYAEALKVLEDAESIARIDEEKKSLQQFKLLLTDRRDKAIHHLSTEQINKVLNTADKETDKNTKLEYLLEARKIAREGLCENPEKFIYSINVNIVRIFMVEANQEAASQLLHGKKYEALRTYEKALWHLLNTGIPDEELDTFDEVAKAIAKIEEIEKELNADKDSVSDQK